MLYQLNHPNYLNRNKGIDLFAASIITIVTGIYDTPLTRFLAIASLRDWSTWRCTRWKLILLKPIRRTLSIEATIYRSTRSLELKSSYNCTNSFKIAVLRQDCSGLSVTGPSQQHLSNCRIFPLHVAIPSNTTKISYPFPCSHYH